MQFLASFIFHIWHPYISIEMTFQQHVQHTAEMRSAFEPCTIFFRITAPAITHTRCVAASKGFGALYL